METNLAVLIDFENIAAGTEKEGLGRFDVESLMRYIKDKGRILLARSYADWGRFSRFKQSLLAANVTMMELTSHGMQDKNRADIAMVVDALELAFTKDYIDAYVVVSGDSDFTPMVLKMRELNKRVIGIGTRKSTSRLLIQACDEFMYYDSLVQPKAKKRSRKGGQGNAKSKAFDLLEEALEGLQRQNPESPLASVVKTAMLRKSPDFAEADLGFSSFARFLEEARDHGIVRIGRDQKSGGYRVDSSDSPDDDEEADHEAASMDSADWIDEYMPDEAKPFVDVLEQHELYPFAFPTRMAVLEALDVVVAERKKRRRKTTLKYVTEDIQKKLRRTHPDMPLSLMKALLEGLLEAGELIHRDGTAIRSTTAAFTLNKDAEALNHALVRLFLRKLVTSGRDLSKTGLLAELMFGDSERTREVEETLAYLAAHADDEDSGPPSEENGAGDLDDLDQLLVAGNLESASAADLDDLDAALVADPEPPKRKPRSSRKPKSEEDDAPTEELKVEPEGEKPKRRTRTRKKAESEAPAEDLPADTNDLLEVALVPVEDEEPKKKPARRRKKPKAEEEASSSEDVPEPS